MLKTLTPTDTLLFPNFISLDKDKSNVVSAGDLFPPLFFKSSAILSPPAYVYKAV